MLKKFVYTLAAAAMTFGFAACSSDEPLAGAAGQDGLVTFTAQLPAELASRAFGEGENAKKLTVYVYEKDVKTLIETKTAEFPADGLTTTVELQLVNGKSYDILFWADAYGENGADTPFSYTASTQTVKVDYTKMASNEDKGDAFFFAEKGLEVKGAINKTIYLTRPFAQINFGTDDLDAAAVVNAFGITADNKFGTVMSKLALTAAMPDQLNLFDGTVTTTDGAAATAFAAVAPTEEDTFPYGTGYDYMSMSYVLVGADRDVVDLKYTVLNGDAEYNTLEIAAVPVQRNYRTNIYGSLLTSKVNFTVEIKPGFGGEYNNVGAIVNLDENGVLVCTKPLLPAGVTEADLTGNGGVALDASGNPFYFAATGAGIKAAMERSNELFFAPNVAITTNSHAMVVPQTGVTIHGNGATISGGEQDFSVNGAYSGTVDININNLNGVKVWGSVQGTPTMNINLTNCTMKAGGLTDGSHSFIMTRGQDTDAAIVNISLVNCHMSDSQLAIHSTYVGNIAMNNCTFTNVGMGINYAKKLNSPAEVKVTNCTFTNCGIAPTETTNSAYNYAAPVRVVDNGGPADAIKLLVDKCTFTGTTSDWDILLMDYRDGKTWFPVDYTITNCNPAAPTVRAL